tara:strand:+ start:78 stop:341 length:264 start_codon:yes stop_codon:yes gene_type:complete
MSKYRFYSKQNGYPGGVKVKYFHSCLIIDENNESEQFIDKNGCEIINNLGNIKNIAFRNKIKEIASKYPHWYYYPDNTIMTDKRIYI